MQQHMTNEHIVTIRHGKHATCLPKLGKTNVCSVLAEALTAHVHAIFADQTSLVGANTAFTRALSIVLWVRVPNSVVSHDVLI